MYIAEKAFFFKSLTLGLQVFGLFFFSAMFLHQGRSPEAHLQSMIKDRALLPRLQQVQPLGHFLGRFVKPGLELCQGSLPASGQPCWEESREAGSSACVCKGLLQISTSGH